MTGPYRLSLGAAQLHGTATANFEQTRGLAGGPAIRAHVGHGAPSMLNTPCRVSSGRTVAESRQNRGRVATEWQAGMQRLPFSAIGGRIAAEQRHR